MRMPSIRSVKVGVTEMWGRRRTEWRRGVCSIRWGTSGLVNSEQEECHVVLKVTVIYIYYTNF